MTHTGTKVRFAWIALAAVIAASAMGATAATAQVFYLYPGAPAVKDAQPATGGGLGIGDNVFRLLGYTRFNINEKADLGFELVLDRASAGLWTGTGDSWRIGLGGDIRYGIIPRTTELPFDLSIDAGLGFQSGGHVTTLDVPVGGVVSRPILLDGGREVTPYGGLYIVVQHVSWSYDVDLGPLGTRNTSVSHTDVDIELRGGAKMAINEQAEVFGTLHVGHGTAVFFGVNWLL